jgi:hypothetical protein
MSISIDSDSTDLRLVLGGCRYRIGKNGIAIERRDHDREVEVLVSKPGLPTNPDHLIQLKYSESSDGRIESHRLNLRVALFKDYNCKAYSYIHNLVARRMWSKASEILRATAINIAELVSTHPELELIEAWIRENKRWKIVYPIYIVRSDKHKEVFRAHIEYPDKYDKTFDCWIRFQRFGEFDVEAGFRYGKDRFGRDRDTAQLWIAALRDLNTNDVKTLEIKALLRGMLSAPIPSTLCSGSYPSAVIADVIDRINIKHEHVVKIDLDRHPDYRYILDLYEDIGRAGQKTLEAGKIAAAMIDIARKALAETDQKISRALTE